MNIKIVALMVAGAWMGAMPGEMTAAEQQVDVCMTQMDEIFLLNQARGMASSMLASAGVKIQWRDPSKCPPDAIFITLLEAESERQMPGVLAYTLPFEGTHVMVFYDRVKNRPAPARSVLAHVVVHEITHLLQGAVWHSESGVMKAEWNGTDYQEMIRKPLRFTEEDVVRIQHGRKNWEVRHAAAARTPVARQQ